VSEDRYRPFDVPESGQLLPLEKEQIAFLELAFRDGFQPYVFGLDSVGRRAERCDHPPRPGMVGVAVCSENTEATCAFVTGFDSNATALLVWLRRAPLEAVLEIVHPHLLGVSSRPAVFYLRRPAEPSTANEQFLSAADYVLRKNSDLYRRLA
jgi:hypothetical protein